jgi:hypothetical protein
MASGVDRRCNRVQHRWAIGLAGQFVDDSQSLRKLNNRMRSRWPAFEPSRLSFAPMGKKMIEFAGLVVSGISAIKDLADAYKDLAAWDERDLPVDGKWLDLAVNKQLLPPAEYVWKQERHVATLELEGTHEVVLAFNKERRTKHRIIRRGNMDYAVLMRKATNAKASTS